MNVFRAAFARDFWITGIAIARYIPRAFRVKQVDGNQFFTEEKRREYRRRVESVTPHSRRQWGTMEVDQMLHHLNLACGGSLGFYNLPDESYLTSRMAATTFYFQRAYTCAKPPSTNNSVPVT